MMLIDIALDGTDISDTARLEDPYLYASKKLPLVYQAVTAKFYRACAFCIRDCKSSHLTEDTRSTSTLKRHIGSMISRLYSRVIM